MNTENRIDNTQQLKRQEEQEQEINIQRIDQKSSTMSNNLCIEENLQLIYRW